MDFAWSEQQRELLSAVDRFASEQLNYDVIANDRDAVFNHEAWKKCGAFGIQGLPVADRIRRARARSTHHRGGAREARLRLQG